MSNIDFIKQLFSLSWNFIPLWVKIMFAFMILFVIIDIFFLRKLNHFFSFFYYKIRDIYYIIFIAFRNKIETKRIESLINWKKNNLINKINYVSKKVIVKNVYDKEKEQEFLDASKKGLVTVIRKKMTANKTENLLNCTISWVIIDYLSSIRKYLTPELSMALINKEIISKLNDFGDFIAAEKFISEMIADKKIKELMGRLDELDMESLLKSLYLPYLRQISKFDISNAQVVQKETKEMLIWLLDYEKRLTSPSTFKFFPTTSFLYVKIPAKNNKLHIKRAIEKFEKQGCKVVMVSGWIEEHKDLEEVSKILYKYKGYFTDKKVFHGHRFDKRRMSIRKRINKIHTIDKETYHSLF